MSWRIAGITGASGDPVLGVLDRDDLHPTETRRIHIVEGHEFDAVGRESTLYFEGTLARGDQVDAPEW